MNKSVKVLFIRPFKSNFIQKDLELLKRNFDVRIIDNFVLSKKKPRESLDSLIKMFSGTLWADITFSWFAGVPAYYAVKFAKIFGKKSVSVFGGYEVAKVPEIAYGAMLYPKYASITKYILKNSDKVLTVDEELKIDAIQNAGADGANIETIPTGYDYILLKPKGEKENLVLTVCTGDTWERCRLKGLDTFVDSAKYLPDVKFLVIGFQGDGLKKLQTISPPNVKFIEEISPTSLVPYYQKSKVYCQLSMREGLPNALCEAMLCECIPVGTNVQGVRTAIGDAGYYASYGEPKDTAKLIKEALKSEKGNLARERIKEKFPIERREKELKEVINKLVQKRHLKH